LEHREPSKLSREGTREVCRREPEGKQVKRRVFEECEIGPLRRGQVSA